VCTQVQADVKLIMNTRIVISSNFMICWYFSFIWNVIPEKEKSCRVVVMGFECFLLSEM